MFTLRNQFRTFATNTIQNNQIPRRMSLWKKTALFTGVGITGMTGYLYYEISKKEEFTENQIAILKKLPLKSLSRLWGTLYSMEIPVFMRESFYRGYCKLFNGNPEEAELPLKEYKSLQEFFKRNLKPGCREFEPSPLVSPVDAKIMSQGVIEYQHGQPVYMEQVKGLKYPINDLLGIVDDSKATTLTATTTTTTAVDAAKQIPKYLSYCILYLGPGDYHRYHSPCNMQITTEKHVTGHLFPVMPLFVRKMNGLFGLNERVVLSGLWNVNKQVNYPFHYIIVGATNVGSIKLEHDQLFKSNTIEKESVWRRNKLEKQFIETRQLQGLEFQKGQLIGNFEMGSTIILVFEHDEKFTKQFQFVGKVGEPIKVGQTLWKQVEEDKPEPKQNSGSWFWWWK